MRGIGGEVLGAIGIGREVVKFPCGPEAKVELPEFIRAILAAPFEDE
jgi:hypothetical protein